METECKNAVQQLEQLTRQLQNLETQIVSDPNQLQAQNAFVKAQVRL